ncbi:MAG: T9SS type A sorting domain-containing protein [Chitinophagales bacterium]
MRNLFLFLLSSPGFFWQQVNAQSFDREQPGISDNHNALFISKDFFNENDGGVSAIYSVPNYQCTGYISPSVEIVNYGSNELTNALIKYFVDSQSPQYFEWEGSLEPGAVDLIEFDAIEVTAGSHKLTVSIVEANGLADINGGNNDGLIDFYIVGTSIPSPVSQQFEAAVLPEGYFVQNDDENGWKMYTQEKEFGNNNYMLQMPFFYSNTDNINDAYIKNLDLSVAGNAVMNFDVAYRYYQNSGLTNFDKLLVQASADCGSSWDVLYEKEKDELATLPPSGAGDYFPIDENEWRTETIYLDNYLGNSNVMIRFEAISGHGNNLYIDNLKISSTVGINEPNDNSSGLKLYPNPASDHVNIEFSHHPGVNAMIMVSNSIGQQIFSSMVPFEVPFYIQTVTWPDGLYLVKVLNQEKMEGISKLLVIH